MVFQLVIYPNSEKFNLFSPGIRQADGKCRNRRRIDLISDETRVKKLAAQPTYKCIRSFHEDLVAVERYKPTVTLNKPIYIGLCVLDLSKVCNFFINIKLHTVRTQTYNHKTNRDSLL